MLRISEDDFYRKSLPLVNAATARKVSKCGVTSGPKTGKYGPEKTSYLDIFHAVSIIGFLLRCVQNTAKHVKWNSLQKLLRVFSTVNYICKKFHIRRLTRF